MEPRGDVIRKLPPSVAEKIAAGEVIERPASVVKELVENSIDAGATRIDVVLEDSGYSLIRVSDNGCGMSAADLRTSIERHATSKISSLDDLFSIRTMGFRGEALASIGSVSRLEIVSSNGSTGLGSRLSVDGLGSVRQEEAPRPRGCTVSVRDLFFNTPARKKFMKSFRSERLFINNLIEQLSVPFPLIHFTLTADGQHVVDAPPVGGIRERIGQIAGSEFARGLIECGGVVDGMKISILLSRPEHASARPRYQCLYVNNRRIDNDTVTYAIRNGFRSVAAGPLNPAFFAFADVDPGRVDVNVHPTKAIVKFDDDKRLFGGIYGTVERGLKAGLNAPLAGAPGGGVTAAARPDPAVSARQADPHASAAPLSMWSSAPPAQPLRMREEPPALPEAASHQGGGEEKKLELFRGSSIQLPSGEQQERWDLISCYQIHDLFILAPIKNGILLIDQHAAHERVLYEQALASLEVGKADSQQLLFPIVMELSSTEKAVVAENPSYFAAFGFELQDFGGNAVSISAVPAVVESARTREAVREMIQYLLEDRGAAFFPEPRHRFAAAFACGAALKAGQRLTQEEMNALLNSLFAARNPYTCPHGRPTLIRMSVDELKRRFLR